MVFFFVKPKLSYESHLSRHTSEPLKKYKKIIEKCPKMPQNGQKFVKIMMQTKVHWCSVFNSFYLFHRDAKHRKHKQILGQNCFENVVSDFWGKKILIVLKIFIKKVDLKGNFK